MRNATARKVTNGCQIKKRSAVDRIPPQMAQQPALTIDYFQDSDLVHAILRMVGVLGIILGVTWALSELVTISYNTSFTSAITYTVSDFRWQQLLIVASLTFNILLVIGSTKCLGRLPTGRTPLLVYAFGHLGVSALSLSWALWRFSMARTMWQNVAFFNYSVVHSLSIAVFPVLLIFLLRRPEFRRVFESR
jgi:hypothetical protein